MKKLIFLLCVGALSACTFKIVSPGRSHEVTNTQVISKAKIFDYAVDFTKRVEGRSEGKLNPPRMDIEYYKSAAVADANIKSNCDFLVNPIYTIEAAGKYVKISVVGYPAKYTQERDITPGDSLHLQINQGKGNDKQAQTSPKKRGGGKRIY